VQMRAVFIAGHAARGRLNLRLATGALCLGPLPDSNRHAPDEQHRGREREGTESGRHLCSTGVWRVACAVPSSVRQSVQESGPRREEMMIVRFALRSLVHLPRILTTRAAGPHPPLSVPSSVFIDSPTLSLRPSVLRVRGAAATPSDHCASERPPHRTSKQQPRAPSTFSPATNCIQLQSLQGPP
jgi:hypothetical protein